MDVFGFEGVDGGAEAGELMKENRPPPDSSACAFDGDFFSTAFVPEGEGDLPKIPSPPFPLDLGCIGAGVSEGFFVVRKYLLPEPLTTKLPSAMSPRTIGEVVILSPSSYAGDPKISPEMLLSGCFLNLNIEGTPRGGESKTFSCFCCFPLCCLLAEASRAIFSCRLRSSSAFFFSSCFCFAAAARAICSCFCCCFLSSASCRASSRS